MYFVQSFSDPLPPPLRFGPKIGLHFSVTRLSNTPGTRGGRDRMLAVKIRKTRPKISFIRKKNKYYNNKKLHISSSYAIILGETNFQPRGFRRSGTKAKDIE